MSAQMSEAPGAQPGLLLTDLQPEGGIDRGKYRSVRFDKIVPPPEDEAVLEDYDLARNIDAIGLQEPLVLRNVAGCPNEERWQIIAGQRRYLSIAYLRNDPDPARATEQRRRFARLQAKVIEATPLQAAMLRINSNTRRRPNPLSDAVDVRRLVEAGADPALIQKVTGMRQSTQETRLRLLQLHPNFRQALRDRRLRSLPLADRIAKLDNEQQTRVWLAYQDRLLQARQATPPRVTPQFITAGDVDGVRRVQRETAAAADLTADLFAGDRFAEADAPGAPYVEQEREPRVQRQATDLVTLPTGSPRAVLTAALRELTETESLAVERLLQLIRDGGRQADDEAGGDHA